MKPPTAPAARVTARQGTGVLLDVAITAVLLAVSLMVLAHGGLAPGGPVHGGLDAVGTLLVACATVPLLAWRHAPLGVLAVTGAADVLLAGLGYPVDLALGPTAALFALAAGRGPGNPWTRLTTGVVVGVLVAYLVAVAVAQRTFPGSELLHTGLASAVAWFAGERTRLRREHVAGLEERASRAEREVERERLLATAEERTRIARDLHDSAGHAISVIAVRAGAARLRHHQDPGRTPTVLREIEELARQTVAEIDQLVGTLREGPPTTTVDAPGRLASLDALIARHTAAGLHISVDVSGSPRPLATAADQAAYRILQESLTNATRHGTGSVRLELAFDDTAVGLTITNPVHPEPVHGDGAPRTGGGHGLIGMRERATLLGGDLVSERTDDAFRVHAHIPYGGRRL